MPIALLIKFIPVIVALVAMSGSFIAGYKYSSALSDKDKADLIVQKQAALAEEVQRRHDVSLEYENKLQTLAGKVRTIVKTVDKEIEKPIYKECVLPESGVAVINNTANILNEARGITTINETATKLNSARVPRNEKH